MSKENKKCSKCKKEKKISDFDKDVLADDGYNDICKKCNEMPKKPAKKIEKKEGFLSKFKKDR